MSKTDNIAAALASATAAAITGPIVITISLETPIRRGDQMIDEIQLRKPASGELRGVTLVDLLQMDVTALQTVLPRLTMPTLTPHDVAQMDPADLLQLGGGISGFLLPKAARELASPAA